MNMKNRFLGSVVSTLMLFSLTRASSYYLSLLAKVYFQTIYLTENCSILKALVVETLVNSSVRLEVNFSCKAQYLSVNQINCNL